MPFDFDGEEKTEPFLRGIFSIPFDGEDETKPFFRGIFSIPFDGEEETDPFFRVLRRTHDFVSSVMLESSGRGEDDVDDMA
mmetsp:Transcript_8079/g.14239  ORF Transcript_8079/g.14239 Transcript_8079/m.14239 type:complete len:81 (+) Transcript_8079:150-392(+)